MRQLTATLCPRRSSATRTNVTVARTNFTSCKATGPSGDGSSDALPDGGGAAALTNSTAVISASAFNLNVAVVCGAVSSPFPAHHRTVKEICGWLIDAPKPPNLGNYAGRRRGSTHAEFRRAFGWLRRCRKFGG